MYFMQMNPDTLRSIWEKDGEDGIIRYGAVVLRRSLTSHLKLCKNALE